MTKLSLLAVSIGVALIGTPVPVSLHWSPADPTSVSLDAAEAKVGRPLTPVSVAGVNRRANRRAYGAGVVAAGAVATGAAAAGTYYYGQPVQDDPYYGQPAPAPYYGQPAPAPYYGQPAPVPYYGQPAPSPYYGQPAPAPYYGSGPAVVAPAAAVAPAPAVVAPAPTAAYVEPVYDYSQPYIVDYRTGRWCRNEPSGYRWCWTP
jgi:hypothetical protein